MPGARCCTGWSRDADVFITNYPPPVRQRLGITYDDLTPLNERLIYASFTGYGETGPEANKPGFDATAWWARTGLMHLVRAGEAVTPARSLPGMGDHPSAMGDLRRDRHRALPAREHRQGQLCQLLAAGQRAVGQWLLGAGGVVRRPGRAAAAARGGAVNALRVHYQCRDGRWLLLSIAADEWRWEKFKACFDDRRRSTTRVSRRSSAATSTRSELLAILDRVFATHDLAALAQRARRGGHHLRHRRRDRRYRRRRAGARRRPSRPVADADFMTVNSPFEISPARKRSGRARAPEVGEHSDEVLRDAGYGEAEIAALREAGVIGMTPEPSPAARLIALLDHLGLGRAHVATPDPGRHCRAGAEPSRAAWRDRAVRRRCGSTRRRSPGLGRQLLMISPASTARLSM